MTVLKEVIVHFSELFAEVLNSVVLVIQTFSLSEEKKNEVR